MHRIKHAITFIFVVLTFNSLYAQSVEMNICRFKSGAGQICVAIFNSDDGFKTEKTFRDKCFFKKDLTDNHIKFKIQLPPGKYGISVLDDKNLDGKMNYNIIGIPKEGFGFGNYLHKSIFKPEFSDFSFEIKENETVQIMVIMQYY